MDIAFRGKYDKQMFLQGLRLVERTSVINKVLRWLSLALVIFVIANEIYTWLTADPTMWESARLIRHAVTALLLGYYYLSPHIARWSRTAALFKNEPYRIMQGLANLEGIRIGPAGGQQVMFPWGQFYRKGKKGQLIAILTLDGNMALFHRDFFETESDWNRFNQLVEQRVIEPK